VAQGGYPPQALTDPHVRALTHWAFQSGSPLQGLACQLASLHQREQTRLGKDMVGPALMIGTTATTTALTSFA